MLVCCASASSPPDRWHDAIYRTDSVLDVEDIVRRSGCLGNLVTIARIADGIHDLSLSPEPARRRFFEEVFRWAQAYVPPSSGRQAGSPERRLGDAGHPEGPSQTR